VLSELATSDLTASFDVVEQWVEPDGGYIRVRAWLTNGDFLEVAEYFAVSGRKCIPVRYRYQWMDATRQQMRKRWDNVEHHPDLPGFPHHTHSADGQIEPGRSVSILDLLKILPELGSPHPKPKRQFGSAKGLIVMSEDFDAPLSDSKP
jgi:hypothetical protein